MAEARKYPRLRVTSPDGLVHTSAISVVAPDGTETPFADVVTRCELICDANDGLWKAVLWVDEVEVDVVVDEVKTRDAVVKTAETKEG